MKRHKDFIELRLSYSDLKFKSKLSKTRNKNEKLKRVNQNPNPFHLTENAAPSIKPEIRKWPIFLLLFPFKKNNTAINPKSEKKTLIKPKRESTNKDPSNMKKKATNKAKRLCSNNSKASL